MEIRPETPEECAIIHRVNVVAFGRQNEADLVDTLRPLTTTFSFVAVESGQIVGHIFFSPVELEGATPFPGLLLGLAPIAVLPSRQRQGIGSALIRYSLEACTHLGCKAIVVLGNPDYYARFGFVPAQSKGFKSQYSVPDEVFRILELEQGALEGYRGLIQYHPVFNTFT